MRYKALVSFSGKIAMAMGDIREIEDASLVDDLMKAGYIIPFEADSKPEKAEKPKKKTTKRKESKKDED